MAEERRQNVFVTLITDGLVLRKRAFDAVVQFPVTENSIALKDGTVPTEIKVVLGRNALSLEEFESCLDDVQSNLKSLGCKMTGDMDMQYSRMSINGGPDEMLCECVLSYVVK